MKYNYTEIGNRIRNLRKQKGYGQKYLEKSIPINHTTLSAYENGKMKECTKVPMNHLLGLAEELDTTIYYILGEKDYSCDENEVAGKVTGLSEESLKYLKSANKYNSSAVDTLNYLLGKFDGYEVLEHIADYLHTIDKIHEHEKRRSSNNPTRPQRDDTQAEYVLRTRELKKEAKTKLIELGYSLAELEYRPAVINAYVSNTNKDNSTLST